MISTGRRSLALPAVLLLLSTAGLLACRRPASRPAAQRAPSPGSGDLRRVVIRGPGGVPDAVLARPGDVVTLRDRRLGAATPASRWLQGGAPWPDAAARLGQPDRSAFAAPGPGERLPERRAGALHRLGPEAAVSWTAENGVLRVGDTVIGVDLTGQDPAGALALIAAHRGAIRSVRWAGAPGLPEVVIEALAALPAPELLIALPDFGGPGPDLARLRRLGPRLVGLLLHGASCGDDTAAYLRPLAGLELLDLTGCALGDAGLAALAALSRLRTLVLTGTDVTSSSLAVLSRLPGLTGLDLEDTNVDDAAGAILARLPGLEQLRAGSTAVGDAGAAALARAPRLVALDLGDTPLGAAGLSAVLGMPRLLALGLAGVRGLPAALRGRALAPDLGDLDLRRSDLDDAGLRAVAGLEALRSLRADGTDVGPDGVGALAALGRLEELGLADTEAGGPALRALAGLRGLRVLDLGGAPVRDADLAALAPLIGLEALILSGTRITTAGVGRLAPLRALAALFLDDVPLGDVRVLALEGLMALRELGLSGTRAGPAALASVARLPRLRALHLRGAAPRDAGLRALAALTNLETLDLSEASVAAAALASLAGLPRLRALSLSGVSLSGAGARALGELGRLEMLLVRHAGLTVADAGFLERLPRLTRLDLAGADLQGEGLLAVTRLPRLRWLGLHDVKLDAAHVSALGDLGTLERLDLGDYAEGTHVPSERYPWLSRLPRLADLRLAGISSTLVGALRALGRLRTLELKRSGPRSPGLDGLACLTRLRWLHVAPLGGSALPGPAARLAPLRRLRGLEVATAGALPVPADLAPLAALEHLRVLRVSLEDRPATPPGAPPRLGHLRRLTLDRVESDLRALRAGPGLRHLALVSVSHPQASPVAPVSELRLLHRLDLVSDFGELPLDLDRLSGLGLRELRLQSRGVPGPAAFTLVARSSGLRRLVLRKRFVDEAPPLPAALAPALGTLGRLRQVVLCGLEPGATVRAALDRHPSVRHVDVQTGWRCPPWRTGPEND